MTNYIVYAPEVPVILGIIVIFALQRKHTKIAYAALVLFAFMLYFYRGYERASLNTSENIILSPAEGTILDIRASQETNTVTIVTFLNVFNRHVQIAPISGVVTKMEYKEGQFHPAHMLEKSDLNERMDTFIRDNKGREIAVRQLAGLLARRIQPFTEKDQSIEQGAPLGLIKFGSRVDTVLPLDKVRVLVQKGAKVNIGDTLAMWVQVA